MGVQIPHENGQFLGDGHAWACPTTLSWAVQKRLKWSRCRLSCGLGRAKELRIRWGPDPTCAEASFSGKDVPGHAQRHSDVSCAKMAEQIKMQFGFCTWLGWVKLRQCSLMSNYFNHIIITDVLIRATLSQIYCKGNVHSLGDITHSLVIHHLWHWMAYNVLMCR